MVTMPLKAPYPWFGGKSRAAELIWERFGDVPNFVDPFMGSLAVLLARPHAPRTETVNDLDGLLSNAWRAIRHEPEAVAHYCDAPVVEVDLHAKHLTLIAQREQLTARLMADPDFYDAKLAGYWIWGACNWIGSGWCSGEGPWVNDGGLFVNRQQVGDAGKGVKRQLPHLGSAGTGVKRKLPHLGDAGTGVSRKLPHLGDAGMGITNPGLYDWMNDLSARLRRVRICCGDWTRVTGESVTTKHGLTAMLLDPPYAAEDADNDVYGIAHDGDVAGAVRAWAIENGENPELRIALCGYEQDMPEGWVAVPWKARKGYQSVKDDGTHNGHREVIHFSPHCLRPDLTPQPKYAPLFGGAL